MKRWLENLAERERRLVLGGAAMVLLVLMHNWVVSPVVEHKRYLERQVHAQMVLLAWMQTVAPDVTGATATGPARPGASLFAAVDRSARASTLAGTVQRIQPEGDATVRVWLDNAPFDELVIWLARIELEQGARIAALAVERSQNPGRVNARITLDRAP